MLQSISTANHNTLWVEEDAAFIFPVTLAI